MQILALSLNHHVTPLEVRESIVFSAEEGREFLRKVQDQLSVGEAMLVSTCNRTEVYCVRPREREDDGLGEELLRLLQAERGFTPRERPRNYALARDEEAVRHLFRVAGGLESQLLGESQILGQVKAAQGWAREVGTVGRVLHRLWERALRVGKRIRTETGIGDGALSASYAALELARKIFGGLEDRKILVIGAGEIALLALENLQGHAIGGLTITNRTRRRAEEIAASFGGEVADFDQLEQLLVDSDVVLSSTAAQQPIVDYDMMRRVRGKRGGVRPLLVVDLALPRDFEEKCGRLDEVFLKNLDDLTEIVESNIEERRSELPRAEAIVGAELETFYEWLGALELEPTIRELREQYHQLRLEELEAFRGTVDDETFATIDRVTRRIINRLLHVPTENLKRHKGVRDPHLKGVIRELLMQQIPHRKSQQWAVGEGGLGVDELGDERLGDDEQESS